MVRFFLCVMCIAALCVQGYSQRQSKTVLSKNVTISATNFTVPQILSKLETKYGLRFMYNPKIFSQKRKNINLSNVSLQKALQYIIQNNTMVFYEYNSYVVIANKKEVLYGAHDYISASIVDAPKKITNNTITYDTIPIYDVRKQIERVTVYDTIRVYDTVQVVTYDTVITRVTNYKTDSDVVNQKNIRAQFLQKKHSLGVAVLPLYQFITNNAHEKGALSVGGEVLYSYEVNALRFGLGVGMFEQRGALRYSYMSRLKDSVLHSETKEVTQVYEIGSYYYINEQGNTVEQKLYDSVLLELPYTWYSYNEYSAETQKTFNYNISWVTIPLHVSYTNRLNSDWNFCIKAAITPSFAIQKGGYIYDDINHVFRKMYFEDIRRISCFASLQPSFEYKLQKNVYASIAPLFMISAHSLFQQKQQFSVSLGLSTGIRFAIF